MNFREKAEKIESIIETYGFGSEASFIRIEQALREVAAEVWVEAGEMLLGKGVVEPEIKKSQMGLNRICFGDAWREKFLQKAKEVRGE